jgi:CheY-like chemotaxis protein
MAAVPLTTGLAFPSFLKGYLAESEMTVNCDQDRPTVLVIEDNPSYRELYAEILEEEFELAFAAGKDDAIKLLREHVFDAALIDMRLKADERGNVEGLDVAQRIRDLEHPTEIVLKSGFPAERPETLHRLDSLNLFRILDKSADNQAQTLLETLRKAVAQNKRQ